MEQLSKTDLISAFKKDSSTQYFKDVSSVNASNLVIKKNYELTYFLFKLCSLQSPINRPHPKHKFVISKTKDLNNEEFGRLSEGCVFKFFSESFSNLKWYDVADNMFLDPSICSIKWLNEVNESFRPFDIEINLGNARLKIEVKSTRGREETVFYLSISELEEILKGPKHYIIARVSFLEEGESYNGIAIHSEFYINLFLLTEETITIVQNSIDDWRNHYKENSIRFTTEHLVSLINHLPKQVNFELNKEPQLQSEKYAKEFSNFIDREFFDDPFRVIKSFDFEGNLDRYKKAFEKMRIDLNEIQVT